MLDKITVLMCALAFAMPISANQLSDPTKPGYVPVPKVLAAATLNKGQNPKWVLSSIKINGKYRSAIINQQSYQVGQLVGRERIKRILSNQVIFSSGKTLSLFDDSFVSLSIKD